MPWHRICSKTYINRAYCLMAQNQIIMRFLIVSFFTFALFVTASQAQTSVKPIYTPSVIEGLSDIGNGEQNIYTYEEAVRALSVSDNDEFTAKSAVVLSLGEQIKNARIKRNCSQEKLAELTGLAPENIESIETNFAVPTMDILLNIQEYLGAEFIVE